MPIMSEPKAAGTRTRYGRLSRPTKEDTSLLDESRGAAQANLEALSEDEGQPAAMSAEEDSDYEPETVQPKTPPARRNVRRGRQTPKARTPGQDRSNGADLFEEESQEKRDIYDFDAQSIISEDNQRKNKRRGRPPGPRRSETPGTPAPATPSAGKASWGSNIYSSIATALKNRSDLDVYTSFLKSSVRNDELDSLYTEVCKPCNSHSTLFYGPSAALQSMMSRINNHDKIIDILRQLMARNLDGLVNRTVHLVPIVQQPLLSTEYLASLTRSTTDQKMVIDCGYVLEQEVNLLSGKFDLGYMSGGIPTIVTSDGFYQKLMTSIQNGEADENRVLLALTDDNQLVAIALVRPDEADNVPYKLKKPIFGEAVDVDNEPAVVEPKPQIAGQPANGGVRSEQETALMQMTEWVQKEAAENVAYREILGDSCAKLRLLDAVLLKPNGKRDVLLLFSGRKPDGHIYALIDEHRFIYQRFGFSKDVPIGLDGMVSAYPEDLLSEKSLLVVPDSLFKMFKKLLTKNVNSAPASVAAKFVLLDKYKKTPLSVVITCGTTLRLKTGEGDGGADEPWTLVCVNGLLFALRIENRFVSKAMELLPVRQFLKIQGFAQPTLCSFWELENRQLTVEVDCSGEASISAQSLSAQTYPCALYEKFLAMDRQRFLGRFVDDFLQRVLSAPVEISLYDQVFRMAQANTPEVVEVPSSSGAQSDNPPAQMEQWGVCSICAKELKAQSSLFDHEMRHLGCNKFSCGEHDFIFHDRKSYRAHMEEFHAGQKLDEDSDFEEDDLEHLRQVIDPHQCNNCNDYFPYAQLFSRHTESCDGVSFQTRTPLNRGLASQRNNPCVAVCGLCGYSLSSRDRLKRHFISMHMQCSVCQGTADTFEGMSQHYKSHVDIGTAGSSRKIITCDMCGEFHGTKHNFYFHQWTAHGVVQPQPKAEALDSSAGDKNRKRRSKVVIAKDELSYQATGSKKFSCKFCSTDVRITGQEYVKHLNSKHGLMVDSNNVCRCCGELCENPEKLSEHLKDVHVPGGEYVNAGIQTIFQCDACPFWGFLKGVIDHSKNVHKDMNPAVYQCHHCQERFSDRKLWRSHLDKHNYSLSHQCDYCDKAFRMRTSLLQHVRNHHMQEDEPVNCEYCGQQYPKSSALKAHIFRMHSAEGQEMKFRCEVCQRKFRLEPELRRHMKEMHSGQIECDICGKECPNLRCYTQHRQKHFRTKIFQCTDCQATFKSKMAMKRHIRVEHLNLGPERYECQICGKVVTQIAMHMLTHKEARYECEVCGKKFTKSTYYNEHVRIHKGEKPFMCHLCGRRFNKKSNLNVHVRFHEKNKDKDGNYLELKNQNRGTYPPVAQSPPKTDAVTYTGDDADARAVLGIDSSVACDTIDLDAIVNAEDPSATAIAAGLKVVAGNAGQWSSGEEPDFKRPKLEPSAAAAAVAAVQE